MKRRSVFFIAAAALLVPISFGVWWFTNNFERKTVTRSIPPKEIAKNDEFLALSRLLESRGFSVRRFSAKDTFWKDREELVFIDGERFFGLDDSQATAVEQWVKAGGHLAIGFDYLDEEEPTDSALNLLDRSGLSIVDDYDYEPSEDAGYIEFIGRDDTFPFFWDYGPTLEVNLQSSPLSVGFDGDACRWAQVEYGAGWILAYTEPSFFSNTGIGIEGHSAVLFHLFENLRQEATGTGSEQLVPLKVAILRRDRELPISTFPWPSLIFPGLVFVVVLIWTFAPRFGPPLPQSDLNRRSLVERFSAEGGFLWAYSRPGTLERLMRGSARHVLDRRLPGLSEAERIAFLTASSGIGAEKWKWVFSESIGRPLKASEFVEFMNLIELMRETL